MRGGSIETIDRSLAGSDVWKLRRDSPGARAAGAVRWQTTTEFTAWDEAYWRPLLMRMNRRSESGGTKVEAAPRRARWR
jgi:hypothetical protein